MPVLSTSTETGGKADVSDVFQVPEPDNTLICFFVLLFWLDFFFFCLIVSFRGLST